MVSTSIFWIVVYCLHPNRCYVSQDIPGGPHKYPTEQACHAQIFDGVTDLKDHERIFKENNKNSSCVAVWSVSCHNGGSACAFDAADSAAAEKFKSMVPLPQ